MNQRVILVDCENVNPSQLPGNLGVDDQIIFFLGPMQKKVPVSLLLDIQNHPGKSEFVSVQTAGKNSVDFHLVYWLGVLTNKDPNRKFLIISKDRGYDTLMGSLQQRGVNIQRITELKPLEAIPKGKSPTSIDHNADKVQNVLEKFALDARPKTRQTLVNFIRSVCGHRKCKRHTADKIIALLQQREFLKFTGRKKRVAYHRPGLQLVDQAS